MSRLIRQKWVTRTDLRKYPNRLYAFGDNMARLGYGGQAREMRGEPNVVGVPTKWTPMTNNAAYFTDAVLDQPWDGMTNRVVDAIDEAFARLRDHLLAGGEVVIPADGLGTGLSELPTRAPKIHSYIEVWIKRLESIE